MTGKIQTLLWKGDDLLVTVVFKDTKIIPNKLNDALRERDTDVEIVKAKQ